MSEQNSPVAPALAGEGHVAGGLPPQNLVVGDRGLERRGRVLIVEIILVRLLGLRGAGP